ncbi:MAG: undecaprenyl/decaprenyl-phosphate alpha-N-acetylglucosaminyl 1-phosphate transferase [Bacteroidetes bacterium]|nr:undecaprenyl/decaprenyl-phosphate alpha-N-acetylglucosaminyl 1-phosphate transferase [Bacteroidota bacterium]
MGGVAILLGVLISLLMCLSIQEWLSLRFFLISIGLMFIIGLRDDVLALTPKQKLYSQFLPIFILVFLDHTRLMSAYGLIDNIIFPEWLGFVLTAFVLLILTNAYNLVDGLDGLAGTVGVIILSFYGTWFYLIGNTTFAYIAFCFTGSLLAFLFFNWQPSRIFMGDTGALMIGLLISYLSIQFVTTNHQLSDEHSYKFTSSVATAICILIVPVFDTLRVIILRLRKLQSPFRADRNHVHHQFLNLGFSHSKSVIAISGISIFFLVIAVLLRDQGDMLILAIALVICLGIKYGLKLAQAKQEVHGRENKIN